MFLKVDDQLETTQFSPVLENAQLTGEVRCARESLNSLEISYSSSAQLKSKRLPKRRANSYSNPVMGVAVFELDGSPKEYLTVGEKHCTISGVNVTFQALKLLPILSSFLHLTEFDHTIIRGAEYCTVLVKRQDCYLALLIRQTDPKLITDTFIQWVKGFQINQLLHCQKTCKLPMSCYLCRMDD